MQLEIDLRTVRKQRKLSIQEAAKQIGVSTQTLYAWERGAQPSSEKHDDLISWLVGTPETPPETPPEVPSTDFFKIYLDLPAGVSPKEMKSYIEDSIQSWCGSYPPEEPMFHLNRDTVHVDYVSAGVGV